MTTNAGDGNDFMVGGAGSETIVGVNVEPKCAQGKAAVMYMVRADINARCRTNPH